MADKRPVGCPTDYTVEFAKDFCDRVATSSKSIATIAKEIKVPYGTIREWLRVKSEFSAMYEQAKRDQADFLVDEILEIADDKSGDLIDTDNGTMANNANVNRSKLQVDARKWAAARLNARKYGDKTEVSQTNTNMNITVTAQEAAEIKKSLEGDI